MLNDGNKTKITSFESAEYGAFGDVLGKRSSNEKLRIGLLGLGYFEYWRMYPQLEEIVKKDVEGVYQKLTERQYDFFDVNILYGVSSEKKIYEPIANAEILSDKLRKFGIAKAIVRREEQFFGSPVSANRQLAEEIRRTENIWGVWTMLPVHCNEMLPEDKLLPEMKKNRIVGWQFFPKQNGYIFHGRVLKARFEMAEKNNIPVFIDFAFISESDLFDVMDEYPELTVILRNASVWPSDRILRPFLSEFPNVYMELSNYLVPDGIETLVADGFGEQILFSTHFQMSHAGGPMMMLKHAGISEGEKKLIASGNIERILEKINYDK